MLLAGLFPWTWFQTSLVTSVSSFAANGALIKKVYFPRFVLPLATVMNNGVQYALSVPVLLLLLIIAAETLFPLLYAYTQPRSQAIQQGRYCFPALAPIALLLALGWRTLLPARWRTGALILAIAFSSLFALAALRLVGSFYRI